jgi:pentatricopeptide repeat protein
MKDLIVLTSRLSYKIRTYPSNHTLCLWQRCYHETSSADDSIDTQAETCSVASKMSSRNSQLKGHTLQFEEEQCLSSTEVKVSDKKFEPGLTLSALPFLQSSESSGGRSLWKSHKVDDSTPVTVWRQLTLRLLQSTEELTRHECYLMEECLQWWTRRRVKFDVVDPEASEVVWKLWYKLLTESNGKPSSLLLNSVLDHWRLSIKQNIKVPYWPDGVISHVQSLAPELVDVKSFALILGAMAYWYDVDPWKAQALLQELPSHVKPNAIVWNSALTVWAKADALRWPDAALRAEQLLERMKQHPDIQPNEVSFTCVLEALANSPSAKAPEKAERVFQDMEDAGFLSPIACLQVMQVWAKSDSHHGADKAYALLHEMVQLYLKDQSTVKKPMKHCFSVVMEGFARRGKPEKVERILLELQDLYQRFHDDDFVPTAATFNSVLSAYARCALPDRAARAEQLLMSLREMAEWSGNTACLPDTTSVNTVVHAWAESNDKGAVEGAEALLNAMQLWEGVQPDAYTYTAVIKAWARSDRNGAAMRCESFLNAMWAAFEKGNHQVKPNDVTYATVIYAWSRNKGKEAPYRAEALFREMMERHKNGDSTLKPRESSYVSLMTTWNRSNLREAPSRVQFYFNQMRGSHLAGDKSLQPSAKLYNAALFAMKRAGDGAGAENILEVMYADFERGNNKAQPNTHVFNTIISAWANTRTHIAPERAEAIVLRMLELHSDKGWDCKPNAITYTCILDCWAKSSRSDAPDRAEEILRHMQHLSDKGDENVKPTTYAWSTVLTAWSRSTSLDAPVRAQQLFDEMLRKFEAGDKSLRPSGPAYASVLSTWSRSNRHDAPQISSEILKLMKERHLADTLNEKPNRYHYSAVISAFASKGDVQNAEALFEEMKLLKDVEPHDGCYNGLIKAYGRSSLPDAAERAESLLRTMEKESAVGADCSPTMITYTSILDIWQRSQRPDAVDRAESLLKEMLKLAEQGRDKLSPNASTFLAFLRVISKSCATDKAARAEEVLSLMKAFKCAPTDAVFRELNKCRADAC